MNRKFRFLPFAYVGLLLVMFILPYFSFPEYSILKNTTSHLGAQRTPYNWVVNVTFILLAVSSVHDGWRALPRFGFHKIVLLIFGSSLILTAYIKHAPIVAGIPFSAKEDHMHSVFSNITGFSFTVFAMATSFIVKSSIQKYLAIAVGLLVVLLTVLMFSIQELMGIWQRLIFIISFAWLIIIFWLPRESITKIKRDEN